MTTDDQNQQFNNSSDFLETFKQLQHGEKTAEKLEKMLDQLEGKLDDLLSATNTVEAPSDSPVSSVKSQSDERKQGQ
ncbi:LADA_0E13168g1_1 [Lachancea dasiensis]|uniref:LADA_0E13168g1_1 n=1 Tax=Lachancea dasiensis TaxID=1072105 RepID=A0A1G4JG85_9SACH|nr:LADA_0E13168g1_1 [Lachancea dasiensis]